MGNLISLSNDIPVPSASKSVIVQSASSFVPLINLTFEGGVVGEQAFGNNAYSKSLNSDAGLVTFDNQHVSTGTRCAKFSFPDGHAGQSGTILDFPHRITDEFWCRTTLWIDSDFRFLGASAGQKFMRCQITANNIVQQGGWDCYIRNETPSTAAIHNGLYIHSGAAATQPEWNNVFCPWPFSACRKKGTIINGAFNEIEYYIKMGQTNGIIRAWTNGELAFERLNFKTVPQQGDGIWNMQTFSGPQGVGDNRFKGGAVWIDNHVITDGSRPPPNSDANGNRMIGNWTGA